MENARPPANPSSTGKADVLVVLAPGAEEIEFITIPDVLIRAGHRVTIAGTSDVPVVLGSRGLPLAAMTRLDDVGSSSYGLVYLPGGKGSAEVCRDDPRVQDVLVRQLASPGLLALICAAPLALIPKGIAAGRTLTSFPGIRAELEAHGSRWLDQPVVVDGRLVTSQGAGTALALALTLVQLMDGPELARLVAVQMQAAPLP